MPQKLFIIKDNIFSLKMATLCGMFIKFVKNEKE